MSRINTNVSAMNAHRNLSMSNSAMQKSIQKLSSGFRINSSADDAAGLALANRLRSDQRSLVQAGRNASQATAMLQVADGAINTVATILDRMKELASQSNSANIGSQRDKLDAEYQQLISEIDRIAGTTTYQGTQLANGGFGNSVTGGTYSAAGTGVYSADLNGAAADTYTIANAAGSTTNVTLSNSGGTQQTVTAAAGAQSLSFSTFGITINTTADFTVESGGTPGSADGADIVVSATAAGSFMVSSSGAYGGADLVSVNAVDVRAASLGLAGDLLSAGNAQAELTALDAAQNTLAGAIGNIGAAINRIEFAAANAQTLIQNTAAAESVIRDADMAFEMTTFTKSQILQQAGTAMLAQANSSSQSVLSLLRG